MVNEKVYDIADYGAMIYDSARMSGYNRALRAAIGRDTVVVDIGTGTGIFALLACRLGARRVYAIEPHDVIQVAREIAAANGFTDRIEFIEAASTDATLPERANVIVSDLGGALPWFQRHIPSIVDARHRFLQPDGTLIPQRDVVWAAVVNQRDLYERTMGPWKTDLFDVDMEAARRLVTNGSLRARVTRDDLLTAAQTWATVDYTVADDPNVQAQITWSVTRAGTGHGVAIGLTRVLAHGICFSNAPDVDDSIRSTVYPILLYPWPEGVSLDEGDTVSVELEARLVGRDYIWTWRTRISPATDPDARKAVFNQSTFFGAPLSPAALRRHRVSRTQHPV